MAILNPYLHFTNEAREAGDFYKSVFGGELNVMTYADGGMTEHEGQPIPGDLVMHSQLTTDEGFTLMLSDAPPGMTGQTPNGHLSLSGDESEPLRGYFDKLADGGTIDVPLETAPWGDAFGQVKDRYGVNWMVNIAGSPS
jgi:PhnB protein